MLPKKTINPKNKLTIPMSKNSIPQNIPKKYPKKRLKSPKLLLLGKKNDHFTKVSTKKKIVIDTPLASLRYCDFVSRIKTSQWENAN